MDRDYKFKYMKLNRKGVMHWKFAYKYDGKRSKELAFYWGNINKIRNNVREDNPNYRSSLWDGNRVYGYNRGDPNRHPGTLSITRKKDLKGRRKTYSKRYKGTWAGQIMGFHKYDGERIDDLFNKHAKYPRLRKKPEKVGGVDCYVIDAFVKGKGRYTLWIDPIHNFHLAKIETQRGENDYVADDRLIKGDSASETFEVLRFERVGDTWFPKECRCKCFRNSKKTGNHHNFETIIKFTKVLFNPDHEALQSFVLNDIPNGVTVQFSDLPGGAKFTLQDGQLIPNFSTTLERQIGAQAVEKILKTYPRRL